MLKINDTVNDFTISLSNGHQFNLYTTLKNSSVLINFIRGTWCEECTSHLQYVEKWRDRLANKKKVTVIILCVEDQEKVRQWLSENPISYMMASDIRGDIAKMYGFMVPEDAYSKPGIMLIDTDKKVRIISDNLARGRKEVEQFAL